MSDVIAGRIDLLDPLARGATGALWRAVDLRFGAVCAAKVMRQRDGADVLRFVREQSVGAHGPRALGAHPHLLPPYTWVAEDDAVVLAMPLIRGGTLGQSLADHGALHPLLVGELTRQLLDALAALHAAGWLHRDVKPANLLLEDTGADVPHLRLADFGIALHEDDARLTETGLVNGTPGYLAPECLRGQGASAAQDVWAAGAVALRALGLRDDLGVDADPQALLDSAFAGAPSTSGPAADPAHVAALAAVHGTLRAMLSADPAARPSASAARDALPHPSPALSTWMLTADGEGFEVFDVLDPLPEDSPARDLPLVPADGPGPLAVQGASLHERITDRARRGTPTPSPADPAPADPGSPEPESVEYEPVEPAAPAASTATPATDPIVREDVPTRIAAPTAHRRVPPPVIVLATIALLALVLAIVLGVLASRTGTADGTGRDDSPAGTSSPASATSSPEDSTSSATTTEPTTTGPSASPSAAVAGRACAWNLEGQDATTADGTTVTCTRNDDDTFTWEER